MSNEGRQALVTGSARGIESATALAFANAGYTNIGINYAFDKESILETVEILHQTGTNVKSL